MFNSIRLGLFLAIKSIRHSNKWTTSLIIVIMLITFLNLIVVSGLLVGLIQGSEVAYKTKYTGDIGVGNLEKKTYIQKAKEIGSVLSGLPDVNSYTIRYITGGSIEANYRTRTSGSLANKRPTSIRGIDPISEEKVTHLSDNIIEGSYLEPGDGPKYIMVGKDLLSKYSVMPDDSMVLRDVSVGSVVRLEINNSGRVDSDNISTIANPSTYEYTIKGVLKVKAADLSQSVFMDEGEFRRITNRNIDDANEIAITLVNGADPKKVKNVLVQNGFENYAKIQTFDEGIPAFVLNMKQTFTMLGTALGSVGIVVAGITLFIVIFINAITRRRQIGILKGIGIRSSTIIWSYIFQSIFYATIGMSIGIVVTFFMLKPYFDKNPIDFAFSDGILVAEWGMTLMRVAGIMIIAIIAGLLPAWMVVRKNTLDAILGR